MQKQQPIYTRKNIHALSPKERKRYFWCLKMLAILPAPQTSSDWYFNSLAPEGVNKIQPKTIHDIMIASHATCCEHFSFYFAHYHRHLMIFLEIWLNYANQVLLSGPDKIKKISSPLYQNNSKLWDIIFFDYKQLGEGLPTKVMAHYWNPTNYRDQKQLAIPLQVADPNEFPHQLDVMDELYFSTRKQYPWDINVKERWFNPTNSFEIFRKNFIKKLQGIDLNYFSPPFQFSPEQKMMIRGKITPRTNMTAFFKVYLNYITYNKIGGSPNQSSEINPSCLKKTAARNLEYFNKTQTNLHLCSLKQEQLQVNFSALKKNMHHISTEEMRKMSPLDRIAAVNYNQMLPYYQLGYALYNETYFSKLTEFMSPKHDSATGFERSHNTMHNNFFFCMTDANLSITNLMFYCFHSWVDLSYELKARSNRDQGVEVKRYLNQLKQYNNYFDYIMFRNKPPVRGEYPIMSWANPLIKDVVDQVNNDYTQNPAPLSELFEATSSFSQKDIVTVFSSRDYILDQNQIRISTNMDDLYHDSGIVNRYKKQYSFFEGFKDYNFNYDYELYETLSDGSIKISQLKQDASNIPEYLSSLKEQVNLFETKVIENIRRASKRFINLQHQKYYLKMLISTVSILGKYRSTIINGAHPIYIQFKQFQEEELQQFAEDQRIIIHSGFIIHILEVLGKAAHAKKCLNCGQFKQFRFEMGEKLYLRFPKLWRVFQQIILSDTPVIYCSNPQVLCNKASILDKILLPKRTFFDDFKIIIGADQILFDVVYKGNEQGTIRINLQSRSVQDGVVKTIASKQSFYLNTHFDFYKLHDVDRGKKQKYFEHFTYTKAIVLIYFGKDSVQFQFSITNYYPIIRYEITIEKIKGEHCITVKDADYDFKKQFYSKFDLK